MNPHSSLWDQLQTNLESCRSRLEELPFTGALAGSDLPMDAYIGLLQGLSVVHGVLEASLKNVETEPVASTWAPGLSKGPLLDADLGDLSPSHELRASPADEVALGITQTIRLRSLEDPLSLLGYLFVLQEPLVSGVTPAGAVGTCLGLSPPKGLRYLTSSDDGGGGPWARAREALQGLDFGPDQVASVLDGAEEACRGLTEIYGSLFPLPDEEPVLHAVALNPEAGRHPVPSDPREVQAAILGGKRTWEVIPYFEDRYGKRGEDFTNSDGAWLVALTDHSQETVNQQVLWLSQVMAARGMPRLTMEVSLREIHKALVEAVPEKQDTYGKLLETAEALRTARCQFLSEEEQKTLAESFDRRVAGSPSPVRARGYGDLLVSAVMDEAAGVVGAVKSLREWMTDPVRFSPDWIEAVEDTLVRAEERVRPGGT